MPKSGFCNSTKKFKPTHPNARPGYQTKGKFNGYLMYYVRSAPKSVEISKTRIGNVLLYFIKKAKNSMGFFFW